MILRFWSVSRWAGIGFGLRQRSGQELRPTQHGTDNESSLQQVVKHCMTLAGNGFTFSICVKIQDVFDFELESTKPQNQYVKQKRRRSLSYYKSQAKRTLLKKKSNMAVSQDRYESCSLDLSPNPDKAKLGLREISEAESKSDSRGSGSDNDTSAVTQWHQAAVEDIEGHEQNPASGEWRLVTRRGIRGRHFRRRSYDNPFWEPERFDVSRNPMNTGSWVCLCNVLTVQHSDPSLILTHRQNLTTDNAL